MSKKTKQISADKLKARAVSYKAWMIKDENQEVFTDSENDNREFSEVLDEIIKNGAFQYVIVKLGTNVNAARQAQPYLVKIDEDLGDDEITFDEPEIIISGGRRTPGSYAQEQSMTEHMEAVLNGIESKQRATEEAMTRNVEALLQKNNAEWEKKFHEQQMQWQRKELEKRESEIERREKEIKEKERELEEKLGQTRDKVKSTAKEIIPALGSLIMDFATGEKGLAGFTRKEEEEPTTDNNPKPEVKPAKFSFKEDDPDPTSPEDEAEDAEIIEETDNSPEQDN